MWASAIVVDAHVCFPENILAFPAFSCNSPPKITDATCVKCVCRLCVEITIKNLAKSLQNNSKIHEMKGLVVQLNYDNERDMLSWSSIALCIETGGTITHDEYWSVQLGSLHDTGLNY